MDTKAVFNNIKKDGFVKTFNLYLDRKKNRKDKRKEREWEERLIKDYNENNLDACINDIDIYVKSNIKNKHDFVLYEEVLKEVMQKKVLPLLYNQFSSGLVNGGIVFVYYTGEMGEGMHFAYVQETNDNPDKVITCELGDSKKLSGCYYKFLSYIKEIAVAQKIYTYQIQGLLDFIHFREGTELHFIKDYADDRKLYLKCSLKGLNPDGHEYEKKLKSLAIKEILPDVYNKYSTLPVQEKVVFLQPRTGLNPSFRYIYDRLKKEGKYEVLLCELHRRRVSDLEYYCNAIEFIKEAATAKAIFAHESNTLMGYIDLRSETQFIQLWHGCGIFKKIGLDVYGKPGYKSLEEYEEYPEYNKYTCVTIASPELSWVYEEFMGIPADSGIIKPIGVSRTDEFFDEQYIQNCYAKLYEKIPQAREKKVILYAPTYRGVGKERKAPDKLDIKKFADAFSQDYVLIIKHHQTVKNLPEIPQEYRNTFAFDMTHDKDMDINDLLTVSDICISDYSSLVFEYSLFERPMLFYVYDLEEYENDRGLYYDLDEITPGPLCKTNEEMIDFIQHIDECFDKQAVIDFKNRFMCSCDGHSTDRILRLIE